MAADYSKIDFHSFVDNRLNEIGYRLLHITKDVLNERIDDIMKFVNSTRIEFNEKYGWEEETREYFFNDMVDKWKYSYGIVNEKDEICLLNFSSVYGDIIHYHFIYTRPDLRGISLAKLHFIKLNQVCLENGYMEMELYCPKNNNRGIILYMRLGWEIQSIRNNKELLMRCDLEKVRNKAYELIIAGK